MYIELSQIIKHTNRRIFKQEMVMYIEEAKEISTGECNKQNHI